MKKYIIISLLAMMLTGCGLMVDFSTYDNGYKITAKLADRSEDFSYWYKLVDQVNNNTLGWYSDKNYNVGDIIWMGARWGKKGDEQ